jgi:2-polyprenyl-6-methoxyphenol hydroxylase-like FAD-dependent oxidoreductase
MMKAIVIGGSLSGLGVGIALARNGATVRILERLRGKPRGAGLGIDLDLLEAVTGVDPATLPVVRGNRYSTAWHLVYAWMRDVALRVEGLTIHDGVDVREVTGDEDADIVVGADGYRSTVRQYVNAKRPNATYAGYMLWRGLCSERDLPPGTPRPSGYVTVHTTGEYRLVAYAVPGADGSIVPGERDISWAWYDPNRRTFLEQRGCLEGNDVIGTLTAEKFDAALRGELAQVAATSWPSPWREAIVQTLQGGDPFGTPIAEYVPDRLFRERVAIIGDAAHVASPMTGSGLRYGFLDVLALARAVATHASIADALRAFERERLDDDRALVQYSRTWGREYLEKAGVT